MEKKKTLHFLAKLLFEERRRSLALRTMTRDVMFTPLENSMGQNRTFKKYGYSGNP